MESLSPADVERTQELVAAINAHLVDLSRRLPRIRVTTYPQYGFSGEYLGISLDIHHFDCTVR